MIKIKDLLNADGAIQNQNTGEVVQEALTAAVFKWKPSSGGRQAAIIVSRLATNQARIARLIGPGSEYQEARDKIVKDNQQARADGAEGFEWVGDTPEAKAATYRNVIDALEELAEQEVGEKFEQVDLGTLFDLGCNLSAEQVRRLSFMLDTSTLEPAPVA